MHPQCLLAEIRKASSGKELPSATWEDFARWPTAENFNLEQLPWLQREPDSASRKRKLSVEVAVPVLVSY